MGGIEQTIQFFGRELRGDLGISAQHVAQMSALLHRLLAALLDQMVGGVAANALRQGDAHRLGEHLSLIHI